MTVLGCVLAGGRSQRFGSDKAVARWRGQPLIAHAIARLRPHVDALVVCGRGWPGETAIPDRPAPDLGPLGGLAAALAHGRDRGMDRVLSVPCDAPALPPALLARMLAMPRPAFLDNLPVIGVWPCALSAELDRLLVDGGSRAVRRWAAIARAEPVALEPGERIANVNAPGDLAALDRER
jgi:molybdopterin-guanine dinucleotide biosynthesis protein A